MRLLCSKNSSWAIQAPPNVAFDVKEQQILDRRTEMEIGGNSAVIFILFLITTGKSR